MKRLTFGALAAALMACSSDPVSPSSPFVGTWVAVTVNGQAPPTTLALGVGASERVFARTLALSAYDSELKTADATWTDSSTMLTPASFSVSCHGFGNWRSVNETTINVSVSCGFGSRDFTLRSDGMLESAVSVSNEGVTVFKRQ